MVAYATDSGDNMVTREVTGNDVVSAILLAKATKSPGYKAKATRYLNKYIEQREAEGFSPVIVEAGIKARITHILRIRKK